MIKIKGEIITLEFGCSIETIKELKGFGAIEKEDGVLDVNKLDVPIYD
jgi:hypothetical protein